MGCGACSRLACSGRRGTGQEPGDDPMGPVCSSEIRVAPSAHGFSLGFSTEAPGSRSPLSLHLGPLVPPTQNQPWVWGKKAQLPLVVGPPLMPTSLEMVRPRCLREDDVQTDS